MTRRFPTPPPMEVVVTMPRVPIALFALVAALMLPVGVAGPASAATAALPSRLLPQVVTLTVTSVASGRPTGAVAVRSGEVVLVVRDRTGALELRTVYGARRGLRIVDTTSIGVVATITRGRTVLSRTTIGPRTTEVIDLPS